MKKVYKMMFAVMFLFALTVSSALAASKQIPHSGSGSVTCASAVSGHYKANTAISYWSRGKVTTNGYKMTVSINLPYGYALDSASSSKKGEEKTVIWFTNTAAGEISHYHNLSASKK